MKNKDLKKGQKLRMHSGDILEVYKKTKKQITFVNNTTRELHIQGLDMYFFGEII
jgi:hypothetical protein